jgi:hypothetical protein
MGGTKVIMQRPAALFGPHCPTAPGRIAIAGVLLALLIASAPQAIGAAKALIANPLSDVTFQAKIIPAHSSRPSDDSSHVVVWLVPATPGLIARPPRPSPRYRIVQRHKRFEPRVLVVPAGSIVEFPNRDPWLHDVFSISRTIPFDLGLYQAGVRKAVLFYRPGVSHLFCSIHPEMMAIVVTVNSSYFGISDNSGYISIPNVPRGKYVLHVWHENSTPEVLEALQRTISVGDDNRRLPTISIALADTVPMISEIDNNDQATFAAGK